MRRLLESTDDSEWVSTRQAVELLQVTPRALYRLIDDGQLPAYRFARVIRLRRRDVIEFRDTHQTTSD